MSEAHRWLALLAAEPRPAGGRAEGQARAHCAAHLALHGYTVAEWPFEYSSAPGRLATPLVGLAWIVTIAAVGHLGAHGHPGWAAILLVAFASILALGVRWVSRHGVLSLPVMRARGVNLVATRGALPRVWLTAHLDSKSQPIPILVRALGIMGTCLVWAIALGLAVAGARAWWIWVTLAGVVVGLPVVASWVGAASPGALDNASGVAAVLIAASRVGPSVPVGIVLTSAEELGLAGARACVRALPRVEGGAVLNCDGVDDSGYLRVMYSGARPERVIRACAGARPGRLPVGVLVDALAFSEAGWDAVTLSRGTLATWGRIHSTRDTADRLTGAGIDATATTLATAARALA